jgi:protein-tyrosine phosphatase
MRARLLNYRGYLLSRPADSPFSVIGIPGYAGSILLCACPGRWAEATHHPPGDTVARDLDRLATAGAVGLLSLVEATELPGGRDNYAAAVAATGLRWVHLPIRDFGTPDDDFSRGWRSLALLDRLFAGENWVIHCRAGLGRTGLVAARLLIEAGSSPAAAIARIRQEHAAGAVETQAQSDYLFNLVSGATQP